MKSYAAKKSSFFRHWQLYAFIAPAFLYILVFHYAPMYGVLMAFKNYKPYLGILGSPWVGFAHFERFFSSAMFGTLMRNTLSLSLYSLLATFPFPIILALALNAAPFPRYKRLVQTVTYAPHFISIVVLVGMLNVFFSARTGIVNILLQNIGWLKEPLVFTGDPKIFPHLYVWSGVWQSAGWKSIIYIAALSGVDPTLHEAATIDGASKLQRVRYIDLPTILPTIIILLIMDCGQILGVGFEKAFLMQNSMNLTTSEIISTYVYKVGIIDVQYGFAAAVGLFNSVINVILLVTVNLAAKKLGDTSLF